MDVSCHIGVIECDRYWLFNPRYFLKFVIKWGSEGGRADKEDAMAFLDHVSWNGFVPNIRRHQIPKGLTDIKYIPT